MVNQYFTFYFSQQFFPPGQQERGKRGDSDEAGCPLPVCQFLEERGCPWRPPGHVQDHGCQAAEQRPCVSSIRMLNL